MKIDTIAVLREVSKAPAPEQKEILFKSWSEEKGERRVYYTYYSLDDLGKEKENVTDQDAKEVLQGEIDNRLFHMYC